MVLRVCHPATIKWVEAADNNNNKLITPFGQLRPLQGGNLARVANLKEVDHKLSSRQVCIEPLHECPHGS